MLEKEKIATWRVRRGGPGRQGGDTLSLASLVPRISCSTRIYLEMSEMKEMLMVKILMAYITHLNVGSAHCKTITI